MQKIVFSLKRTLAFIATAILGYLIIIGIIGYFLILKPADFTPIQWILLGIGASALSGIIQYVLINLIRKYMPLNTKETV